MQSGIYQENGKKIHIIETEKIQMDGAPEGLFQLSFISPMDMPNGDVNIVENGLILEKVFIYKVNENENRMTNQTNYQYVTVRIFFQEELDLIFEIIEDGKQEEHKKFEVVKKLEELLKLTRADVDFLCLNEKEETVAIHFNGGGLRIANVAADSELALIHDVLTQI